MASFKTLALLLAALPLAASEPSTSSSKHQITYLVQSREYLSALDLYQEFYEKQGRHDFEVLEALAKVLLEEGLRSQDLDSQLLSLFGVGIGGYTSSIDVLENAILSPHPEVQQAGVHLVGQMQDDRSDDLLTKAMSSDFFAIRMEAAHQLAIRKARSATGQIEALMYRVPHQMRFLFPQFFALIGTPDAISVLKHLIEDKNGHVRAEALLAAAQYGRDDLLPLIRMHATHLNIAEEEVCANALGVLKDTKSLPRLQKLATSPTLTVRLSALYSLHLLGDDTAKDKIFALASSKNLFAISLIGSIAGGEEILAKQIKEEDIQVRLNAAASLLKRRDPRACDPILEMLIRDSRDLGFEPQFSLGKTLMAWRAIPSLAQRPETPLYDLPTISLAVREHLLRECLELPEKEFLKIAERIFRSRQTELIPLLVRLLENLSTDGAISLLQEMSRSAGAPLLRAYSSLSLFRLNTEGPYTAQLHQWLSEKKHLELIRFRPNLSFDQRFKESPFELTPEESSRLLIEVYLAMAQKHDSKSIDVLLEGIRSGNTKNRYVLAGLLIAALQ